MRKPSDRKLTAVAKLRFQIQQLRPPPPFILASDKNLLDVAATSPSRLSNDRVRAFASASLAGHLFAALYVGVIDPPVGMLLISKRTTGNCHILFSFQACTNDLLHEIEDFLPRNAITRHTNLRAHRSFPAVGRSSSCVISSIHSLYFAARGQKHGRDATQTRCPTESSRRPKQERYGSLSPEWRSMSCWMSCGRNW